MTTRGHDRHFGGCNVAEAKRVSGRHPVNDRSHHVISAHGISFRTLISCTNADLSTFPSLGKALYRSDSTTIFESSIPPCKIIGNIQADIAIAHEVIAHEVPIDVE